MPHYTILDGKDGFNMKMATNTQSAGDSSVVVVVVLIVIVVSGGRRRRRRTHFFMAKISQRKLSAVTSEQENGAVHAPS